MVAYRRGAKCNNCCAEPECSLSVVSILFNGTSYTWTVAVYYDNVSSATLTGYGGSAFTFPTFNGTVTFTADKCEYNRLVLHVESPDGYFKDCVWNNPNCCCVLNTLAPCTKYRIPLSNGINADQPSIIVSLSGAQMSPTWASCVDMTGFFNGNFLVPFTTRYGAFTDFPCTYMGFSATVRCYIDILWHYEFGCDFDQAGDEGPALCNPSDAIGISRRHFIVGIRGGCYVTGLYNASSVFTLSSRSKAYQIGDYRYTSCNPYSACSNPIECVHRPKAPMPPSVSCASQVIPGSNACCGYPCRDCSAWCGGALDFSGIQAAFAEA